MVAGAIGAEFISPEFGELVFPSGQPPAVPEISVHKNGDTFFRKDDVRTAGKRTIVASETQSQCPKLTLN